MSVQQSRMIATKTATTLLALTIAAAMMDTFLIKTEFTVVVCEQLHLWYSYTSAI